MLQQVYDLLSKFDGDGSICYSDSLCGFPDGFSDFVGVEVDDSSISLLYPLNLGQLGCPSL